jgi:hypothetical protein
MGLQYIAEELRADLIAKSLSIFSMAHGSSLAFARKEWYFFLQTVWILYAPNT